MNPYVGQLLCVGFNFAPQGWALCNGALLPIAENEALFNLIGTTYGGDGQTTFGLPDLRGRIPLHMGGNYVTGVLGGVESVTVTTAQMPLHTHAWMTSAGAGTLNDPSNAVPASGQLLYKSNPTPNSNLSPAASTSSGGGGQPHDNMQPFLVLNWIISLYGIYPSQS